MKPSTLLLTPLAILPLVTAGSIAGGGCAAAYVTAAIACHAVAHSMSPFTFRLSSLIGGTGCHVSIQTCIANCAFIAIAPTP